MSKPLHKRFILICIVWIILFSSFPVSVLAEVPYLTFTKDSYQRVVYTQPAYEPSRVIGKDIYITNDNGEKQYSPLKRPQDFFVAANDDIYIADTDNNRVVQFNAKGETVRVITLPESPLKQPQGIFVDGNGDIYIADTGNKRVVRLNKDGRLIQEYARPESNYINNLFVYEPVNMVVDQRGFVYIVSTGSYQGIIQFDPEGKFYGFFGTNSTEVSVMDRIRRMFYSKEQLSRQVRLLPVTIRNIFMDDQGFVYTVSGSASEQVKKLNISGDNLWKEKSFGEKINLQSAPAPESQLNDIAVDKNGNMTVIDKALNVVSQYSGSGELLFFWSGTVAVGNPQLGLNQSPVAVDSNSHGELLILDDALNLIQVFEPTEFGQAVHQAFALTQDGKYAESEEHWNNVEKLNALYSPAYKGLAQAASYREDYGEALDLFRLAGDIEGYSDTFWQLRLEWFQKHFSFIANSAIFLGVAMMVGNKVRARRRRVFMQSSASTEEFLREAVTWRGQTLFRQMKHAFTILKHPIEGFGDLRYMNRGSYLSAFLLLGSVIVMLLAKTHMTGFTFSPVPVNDRNGGTMVIGLTAVWLTWVICAYLIGSIRQGEARFKDMFIGSAYALFPIILLSLPIAAVSNLSTLSEASIYHFMESLMIIWCGLLIFWNVQSVQNYTVGETVVHILLTFFAMIMLWVLLFILFGLSSEFIDFINTIYQEVSM